jgi:hypothetical protein
MSRMTFYVVVMCGDVLLILGPPCLHEYAPRLWRR